MIGMAQEKWLFDGLATSRSKWNVIANDVILARLHQGGVEAYYTDGWDGFPPSRQRLLDHIAKSKPSNPVAITGDIHSFWANDIKADFADETSPVIASELIGTSITSNGVPYETFAKYLPDNPHVKFFESRKRGYVSVELTRQGDDGEIPGGVGRHRCQCEPLHAQDLCGRGRQARTGCRLTRCVPASPHGG